VHDGLKLAVMAMRGHFDALVDEPRDDILAEKPGRAGDQHAL